MKLKYFLFSLLFIGCLMSCKSKKKVAQQKQIESSRKDVTQIKSESKEIKSLTVKHQKLTTEDYISMFKDVAMDEMRKFKIPASIKLAQGILESSSGNSDLTKRSNNHFGIKCHKGWKGKRTYHDDDEKGECFRVYEDPRTSFRDHSLFLVGRDRYSKLFKYKQGDYVSWAKGLSAAGYATDRRYPAKLIALIEKYNLQKYDAEVLGKPFERNKKKEVAAKIHIVQKGDTLYSISRKYGLSVDELKKINKLNSNAISIGQELLLK